MDSDTQRQTEQFAATLFREALARLTADLDSWAAELGLEVKWTAQTLAKHEWRLQFAVTGYLRSVQHPTEILARSQLRDREVLHTVEDQLAFLFQRVRHAFGRALESRFGAGWSPAARRFLMRVPAAKPELEQVREGIQDAVEYARAEALIAIDVCRMHLAALHYPQRIDRTKDYAPGLPRSS